MSIIVYFVAKKFASKGWVLKVSHFRMNNITIIYIIVVILVMSGLFQNQMEGPVSRGLSSILIKDDGAGTDTENKR